MSTASVMLRPSLMPGASTAIPVSTPVLTDTPESTTTESVMLRPSPMPGASTAILVSTPVLTDTPMAVSTTSMASVMLRPSLMPGASTAIPVLTDTPMVVSTTSMASVMLRPSLMPGVSTATATQLSTLDTHMPSATSTASKELVSSGLNCGTFKNCLRRIIQLPDSWIPKKQVQNDYLLQTNSLVFL